MTLALALVACETRVASLASVGQSADGLLLDLGQPCSAESDCSSSFCVDGVCCDSACGGGVRDLLSCSNIYGAVSGLVDGTCATLRAGDFCGALTSVNPCTWRGSQINGGGQCPNPPGTSVACFPCTSPADCGGAFPVCVSSACVSCDGDYGSGTAAACPSTAPVCKSGQCGGCSGCGVTTPVCNQLTSACSACNGDYASGATLPCPSATAPACLATGACAQCSASNASACSDTTPSCDTTTNTCVGCAADYGSTVTPACTDFDAPLCLPSGACGRCSGTPDCSTGDVCNTALGNCGAACTDDTQCATREWCASGVCTPKLPNGTAMPPIAPIDGTCTSASAARVCLSGVCSTVDNFCGLPNDNDCSADAQCRSGTCFTGDHRCGLPAGEACVIQTACRSRNCSPSNTCGDCGTDADCGAPDSGIICDAVDLVCTPGCRGVGGNGCPADRTCTSTDERVGKCAQCLSDDACGDAASGQVCSEDRECVSGCRGEGGNGCAHDAVCTSGDGSVGACFTVEGGGPSCASSGNDNVVFSAGVLALIAIAVSVRLFRRRCGPR